MVCYNRFGTSSSSAGIAAGAPGEEGLGGPRGVGGSTVAMAKGKKQKSAKKLALAKAADAETKADGGNDAAPSKLNRPSLAALASAGAPGAASTREEKARAEPMNYTRQDAFPPDRDAKAPSRSGKQLWALDSVKDLAPTATKKRSMFMSAYKSLKRAAGIPSKKDRPALSPAKTSAEKLHSPPRLDGTLPDVRGAKEENALGKIPRLDTAKTLAGLRDADAGHRDRRESHAAYLDALRRALPSDYARPERKTERTAKDAEALEAPEAPEALETAETLNARLPAPRVAEASSPLSPPRARFARAVRGLVGDMRRRHEASIATARGMLRSLDALEGLEPAAVAFGRVQKRADTAFWSGLPPVAYAAVEPNRAAVPEEARRPSVPEARKSEKRAARASPTHPTSFTASLESLKLLSPKRKPPTPRVVEARHEERRDAEAKTARESESFAFWAPAPASRSASAPASPSGASPRASALDARGCFGDSFGNDGFAMSTRKGKKAAFPGREARANDPAAAAVAAAASRVHALPASVARRLAAAEAMRGNDAETPKTRAGERSPGSSSGSSASDELAPRLFRTWVAGPGGSRFSATAERARGEASKPSAAALAAARARDAARGNRISSSSSSHAFTDSIGRNHTNSAKTTNSARRGDESSYGRAVVSPPPARRAGDLDRLRAMRRRLQAEYEVEARAMRLRNSQGLPRTSLASPTKSSARKRNDGNDVLGVSSESPRSPGESKASASASAEGRSAPPDGNAEEEVWHDLARLGGFASFEEVPSSAKPLDVPSARLRAAYAMEAHRKNGGSFGPEPPGSGRDPTRRDEVAAPPSSFDSFTSSPATREIVPRAVGSPETAKAGFDALFRRREARRAAEANAVRRPRTVITDGGGTYRR